MIETNIDILCPSQSAVTIDNPSIDDNIKVQTTHVQDYIGKLLLALNVRASLLANAERLDLALNDAMVMMTLVPSSPLGYLRASDIHSLRGQYAIATETLNDGLKRVSASEPQYAQLVNAREVAYNKSIKRIDFISMLPLDIVTSNIIPRVLQGRSIFQIGRPCYYIDVCRTWRHRIPLVDGLKYEIGPADLLEDGFERVEDLAPFMRSLTVVQPDKEILSKITQRHPLRLNMLKELRIIESIRRGSSLLLSSLRLLSDTVTDLRIEYGYNKSPKMRYRLCDILEACPNLESIRMDDGDIDMASVTKAYPKVIKLELLNMQNRVKLDNVSALLQPFPRLRLLKIAPGLSESFFLPIIDQHCPLLEELILWGRSPHSFGNFDAPERKGLRALIVPTTQHGDNFKEDDIVQYLMKHSETLETFGVVATRGFGKPKSLLQHASSQKVTFKRLRQIHYPPDVDESLVSFLLWVIQHAPHLEFVDTVAGHQQTRIMQELIRPEHAHIKRLGMEVRPSRFHKEEEFIQHHMRLGQQSNLTEMKIYLPPQYLHDSWLRLIPRLTQLVTLEFCAILNHLAFKSLSPLMEKLADGCPALEQLTMTSNLHVIRLSDLYPMDRHRNLKGIVINCQEMLGDTSTFRQRFTNIESLHLTLCRYRLEDIDDLEKGSFKFVFTERLSGLPYFLRNSLR